MIIRSRSPVRISFAGGGTDVPPYPEQKGGCVLSATINKYAYSTLESRGDGEIHIHSADFLKSLSFRNAEDMTYNSELDLLKAVIKRMNPSIGMNIFMRCDVPPKSGLGSSAAAFSAMIGLFNHMKMERKMTDYEVAELAYTLERDELKVGRGRQDQYATVFGGINFIEFGRDWVRVNPLRIKKDHMLELEKHLVLAYIKPRHGTSNNIIDDQTRRYLSGDASTVEGFDRAKEVAVEMRYALLRGDLMRFGELLNEGWEAKKKFSPMISSRHIDDIYEMARRNGALGGKITGAGGSGFFLFFCEPNREHILSESLENHGLRPMTFTFDMDGLQTWDVSEYQEISKKFPVSS
ncbi:MAG: GHMP kinase [Candidatus Aenigmarchaeota archaeon]|nr:GHMP kinase [Candidatus Aenigmarchaeota archaeon]